MRVCCVCYLYVCVCADLCMCVLETHISALFVFFALLAAAVSRLYYTVPQALKLYGIHFVATAVQQQSHIKLFPCDGHGGASVCALVCRVCCRPGKSDERIFSERAIDCLVDLDDINPQQYKSSSTQ